MRRREFIIFISAASAWPLTVRGQQPAKPPVIGYLSPNSEAADRPRRTAFMKRLSELGWIDGQNIRLEFRWSDGIVARTAEIAPELVRLPADVLVSGGDAFVLTLKRATPTIPIVFASAGDPVGNGLVESLARPGGNVTGLSIELPETVGKRLELLHELIPALHRLAIAFNSSDPQVNMERNTVLAEAQALGLDIVQVEIRPGEDFAPAIEPLKGRVEALYVCLDPLVVTNAARINALALAAKLPVMHGIRENAAAGGVISYGPNFPDMSRRAAEIVDKILHGAKPADIPVEQPTKFDLVINLKTAKALGVTIPGTVLARADEVIE
jgi:putative tryptophan/tyrosine transport system substrate-binding protein